MKNTIVVLALAGIFSLPAMAQPKQGGSPEQRASKMTEHMTEKLELTADQKESVYNANLEMATTMKESRRAAQEAHKARMKEILTDEQYEKLEKMQKNGRKKIKHRRMESSDSKELQPAEDSDQLQESK